MSPSSPIATNTTTATTRTKAKSTRYSSSSGSSSVVREKKFTLPESGANAQIANSDSTLAVIVTHPWGPLGGNMNNNVVMAIVVWFQRLRITTMRFDFCGSQIGRGTRQVEQVKEAAMFLLEGRHLSVDENGNGTHTRTKGTKPPNHVLLVGYSYGSIISASASATIPRCIGVAMISPPLAVRHWLYLFSGNYHLEQARQRGLPLLMIMGSNDNFTSEDAFYGCVHTMPQSTTTGAVLKDADHFFRGREKDLMDVMGHWILNVFPQCNGDLKTLKDASFPVFDPSSVDSIASSDSYFGCNAFSPGN